MTIEGRIINSDSDEYGQVEIGPSGLIEKIGPRLGEPDIKTPGLIFPGFVDLHVHAREDASGEQNYKEDFRSMSEAAIHGGVAAVCDMPNNRIMPVSDELMAAKQHLAKFSLVDIVLYGAVLPGSRPLQQDVPYKAFIGPSVGDMFFSSITELKETISSYRGKYVSFHCEDPEILKLNEKNSTHEARRPREAEVEAIRFALELAREYELKVKICHVSTAEAVEVIARAKTQGLTITAEVTPHHLYFDVASVSPDQLKLFQVNPPLRTGRDREALLEGLKSGILDFLASDHAPHTIAEKKKGISGLPQLDTFGAFTTWLIKNDGFTPQDIARICADNPGKFINNFISEKFGRIEQGYAGSLTIIDPVAPQTISRQDLKTKCGWSPFEGVIFPGRVTHTIVRGKLYAW